MTRTAPVLVAALLVVGTLAAFPVAGLAAETETAQAETEQTNASENASIAPGAQLSGVVGVGEAELEGGVESRAFGIQIAQAKTNASKADVVAERLGAVENRLGELEAEKQRLDEARANGSMSDDEYRAKVAVVHARTQSVERIANKTDETTQGLPAELLAEKDINVSAIQTLKDRANELGGPETAAIAQSIAGKNVGQAPGPDVASDRGQSQDDASDARSGNETDQSQGNQSGPQDGGNESVGADGSVNETDGTSGNDDGQSEH